MKVKLLLNIGSVDARRLGLARTLVGSVVDVPEPVGRELLKNLWAREATAKDADDAPADDDQPDTSPPPIAAAPAAPALKTSAQLPDRGAVRPDAVDAGAPADDKGGAPAPDLGAMTKAELVAYAADRGIEGVTADLRKDDMVAAIEDAETRP